MNQMTLVSTGQKISLMLKLTNGSFENNRFFGLNVSHLNSIRMTPCLMERIMGMDVEVVL